MFSQVKSMRSKHLLQKQLLPRFSAEKLVRGFVERKRAYLKYQPVEHSKGETTMQYSRDREEISKGKRSQLVDEDLKNLSNESEEAEAPRVEKRRARKPHKELPT